MTMAIQIASEVEPGFRIRRDGQEYTYKRDKPDPKILADGRALNRVWGSSCKSCGSNFEFDGDMDITYMTRRCAPCRPRSKK